MKKSDIDDYKAIKTGAPGYVTLSRGLFEISGTEATQFLNGLVTNDVARLAEGEQIEAVFPTVNGRVFAFARIAKKGETFLLETEGATREKVFENLFRFTFAGDFSLRDFSDDYVFIRLFGDANKLNLRGISFANDFFMSPEVFEEFRVLAKDFIEISDELYELLRVEAGIPIYGKDMNEETVVPEIAGSEAISYNKGCYIGQEVIARIHFLGKPAKRFSLLQFSEGADFESVNRKLKEGNNSLETLEGKNAGFLTSVAFSTPNNRIVALGFLRTAAVESANPWFFGYEIESIFQTETDVA
ncbi:MAG: YgfZ/GcvT domain-containing protein [Pyrinomonadaceae bacterium]